MEPRHLAPAVLVDHLPVTWWAIGNLHTVFGSTVHFCSVPMGPTADDLRRTIEWNGREIGRGRTPFPQMEHLPEAFPDLPTDYGWSVVRALILASATAAALWLFGRRRVRAR